MCRSSTYWISSASLATLAAPPDRRRLFKPNGEPSNRSYHGPRPRGRPGEGVEQFLLANRDAAGQPLGVVVALQIQRQAEDRDAAGDLAVEHGDDAAVHANRLALKSQAPPRHPRGTAQTAENNFIPSSVVWATASS